MEEQQLNPLALSHLLQHALRSLCSLESSHWIYAVFWRILPRNFPPPKWDLQGAYEGAYDRARGSRRNWILAWEDGFCNFVASGFDQGCQSSPANNEEGRGEHQTARGLQPELFFKMSHEIYNYGEGLIGNVAADHGHKWVYKDPQEQDIHSLSTAWNVPADSHPRIWEAQFQSGIKTIALIAVREGVVQLGSVSKIMEDVSYVAFLRKKFAYLESIPGVLFPHPLSSSIPAMPVYWRPVPEIISETAAQPIELHGHFSHQMIRITPSMSSLEALLSNLPSVRPAESGGLPMGCYEMPLLASAMETAAANDRRPAADGDGGERG